MAGPLPVLRYSAPMTAKRTNSATVVQSVADATTDATTGTDATPSTPPAPVRRFKWKVRNLFADCIGDVDATSREEAEAVVRGWLTAGLKVE